MIKVFISQPMQGKTEEEIMEIREKAIKSIRDRKMKKVLAGFDCINVLRDDPHEEIVIMDSYFADYNPDSGCIPLKYLAKAIEMLADADIAYFAKGWQDARGCRIENKCAIEYGIKVIEEDMEG